MFVQPKFESDDIDRSECESIVGSLGKFEQNPAYVPYMWNRILMWGEIPDNELTELATRDYCESAGIDYEKEIYWGEYEFGFCDRYRYTVTLQDIANFPELSGVAYVALWESDQGFVYCEEFYTESKPILFSPFIANLLIDLSIALVYDLAIQGMAPKPVDGLSKDKMIERRDFRLLNAWRYVGGDLGGELRIKGI